MTNYNNSVPHSDYCLYCMDVLKKLVSFPSSSQNERKCAEFLANFLEKELGMEGQILRHGAQSASVIARYGSGEKKIILGGHIDTVKPSDKWVSDPYKLLSDGDKLRGLGAGDMKGGIAAVLTVIKMIRDCGIKLNAQIEFVGLADEERFSIGAEAYAPVLMKEKAATEDMFFIMAEPHFDNIVVGASGKSLFNACITGKTGHASDPRTGINAVNLASKFLCCVDEKYTPLFETGRSGSCCCLNISSKWHGYELNIPATCECLINKQFLPEEHSQDFIDDLITIYQSKVGCGHIDIIQEKPNYPAYLLPSHDKHLMALLASLKKNGRMPELRVNHGVSDANITYGMAGVSTVLYGPQGVNFHTENEYLLKSTLFVYIEELFNFLISEYNLKN